MVILTLILVISWPTIGFGITTATPSLSAEQIQLLNRLLTKVAVLQAKLNELQAQAASLPVSLRLTKQLSRGTSDEEIKVLQEMLATDPEIYPEGHTTGYFGPLTEKALRKFQKKTGLTDTGKVDGQTLWRVNQLLTEGAGHLEETWGRGNHDPTRWRHFGADDYFSEYHLNLGDKHENYLADE